MTLITEIAILVLAAFVGFEVISKVPNTLHTPLMSGTNAIHGVVLLWRGLLLMHEAHGRAGARLARDRDRVRHDQRGRRFLGHRPDAGMFKRKPDLLPGEGQIAGEIEGKDK